MRRLATILICSLIRKQQATYPSLAACIRQQIENADPDERLAESLRVALMLKELTAFASHPTQDKAFAIEAIVWDPLAASYHDPQLSIEGGKFALKVHKFAPNSVEREVVNKPLFIKKSSRNWLRPSPTFAPKAEVPEKIIKDHKEQHGDVPMRLSDFIEAARALSPRLSGLGAKRLWKEYAPDRWKRPGTKKNASGA